MAERKRKTDSRFRLDMNITTAIGFCLRGKKAGKNGKVWLAIQ